MPIVSEHHEAGLKRIIRDAMALNPLILMKEIKALLEQKTGRTNMDNHFVKKLVRKVTMEMTVRVDTEKAEKRIAQLRERNRIIIQELIKIAFDPTTSKKDRVAAASAVARIENAQVKLEMDLGLFTRHLGEIDVGVRLKPVEDAVRDKMLDAFKTWNISSLEPRRIKDAKVIDLEVKPVQHEPTEPKPKSVASTIIKPITGAGLVATE